MVEHKSFAGMDSFSTPKQPTTHLSLTNNIIFLPIRKLRFIFILGTKNSISRDSADNHSFPQKKIHTKNCVKQTISKSVAHLAHF